MRDPLAHLPGKVTTIVPLITNAVIRAAHGEPPLRKDRLNLAIVHAQHLVEELKTARLALNNRGGEDIA